MDGLILERYMIVNNNLCAMAQNRYTFFTRYSYLYDILLWNSMSFAGAVSFLFQMPGSSLADLCE